MVTGKGNKVPSNFVSIETKAAGCSAQSLPRMRHSAAWIKSEAMPELLLRLPRPLSLK